ncbi:hypothetical protein EBT25_18940 [bacterium]|nr:hypothetical protein [bacterium]
MPADRTFTVQGSEFGVMGGTYKSSSPMAAAKKASRILFKSKKGAKSVKFILRETTRDSAKKSYFYEAFVHYFDEPKVVSRGGVDIEITKEVKIKTCQEHQMHTVSRHGSASPVSA